MAFSAGHALHGQFAWTVIPAPPLAIPPLAIQRELPTAPQCNGGAAGTAGGLGKLWCARPRIPLQPKDYNLPWVAPMAP